MRLKRNQGDHLRLGLAFSVIALANPRGGVTAYDI
jgi:hypothetical protein